MDAAEALADLTEISSQVDAAVLFDGSGRVEASTLGEDHRSRLLAESARILLEAAEGVRAGGPRLTQLEAATSEGSVFVVRDGDRVLAATTGVEPTAGLVSYDLRTCLRSLQEAERPDAPPETATAARSGGRKQHDGAA